MFVTFWKKKNPPGGLADVGMLFITHATREYTDSGGSVWERQHLLQSEAHYKGSQTCVLCVL